MITAQAAPDKMCDFIDSIQVVISNMDLTRDDSEEACFENMPVEVGVVPYNSYRSLKHIYGIPTEILYVEILAFR